MTAGEVLPWLILGLATIAFFAGIYLLIRGVQSAAPGSEEFEGWGITFKTNTPGLAVTIVSFAVLMLTIKFGIIPATTDEDNDDNDGGASITNPIDDKTSDPPETPDPPDNVSGLEDSSFMATETLNVFTRGLGLVWGLANQEERPALDCLQGYMIDQPGRLKPIKYAKWRSTAPDTFADAATTVVRFEDEADAMETYDRIVGWLDRCGERDPLPGGRDLDVAQAGVGHDVNGRIYWRNYPALAPGACSTCMLVDSQAVGRVDDTVVIFSIAWIRTEGFSGDAGPIQAVMQRALALAAD